MLILISLLLFFFIQVCHHKGILHSFSDDLLLRVRRPSILAHPIILLDRSSFPNDEAPNHAHGQVQIHPFQLGKTGTTYLHGYRLLLLELRISYTKHIPYAIDVIFQQKYGKKKGASSASSPRD